MDKYKKMAVFLKQSITPEFIAEGVTKNVDMFVNSSLPMDAKVAIAWNRRDILEVSGFYVVPDIVQEFISCYIGLLKHAVGREQFNINFNIPSTQRKMGPIIMATKKAELAAIPIAIAQMETHIGIPLHVDIVKAEKLMAKRNEAASDVLTEHVLITKSLLEEIDNLH
jgi:hypothetical protein